VATIACPIRFKVRIALAGHLLPEGGVFAFLASHRHDLFPETLFTDLFAPDRGRPSVPVEVVASVIVLQMPA
jgi:hypothetical protein